MQRWVDCRKLRVLKTARLWFGTKPDNIAESTICSRRRVGLAGPKEHHYRWNELTETPRSDARAQTTLIHITTIPASLVFLRGQAAFMRSQGIDVHVITAPGRNLEQFAMEEGVTP